MLVLGDALALAATAAIVDTGVVVDAPRSFVYVLAIAAAVVLQGRHLYRTRLTLALSEDLWVLSAGVAVGAITGIVVSRVSGPAVLFDQAAVVALVAGSLLVTTRSVVYAGIRSARRHGWVSHRAIVVGTDATAARLAATLEAYPEHGLRVVGFVGEVEEKTPERVRGSVLAPNADLLPVLTRKHRANAVLMTMAGVDCDNVLQTLRVWGPPGRLTVYLVPPLFQMMHGSALDRVRDIVLIPIRASVSRRVAWRIKGVFDKTVAAALLLLLSPILLVVAAAVRWEGGPGVLFRQTRVGIGGRPFTLYKFRSLRPANESESASRWSVAADERLGPVGRLIRKSSLDELPQLLNILRGDMSLVGPRPERPFFVEQFGSTLDSYALRHRVKPGLTGWAAVSGLRGDTSIQERAYYDNVYIDNWSLSFDLKILALTALSVVKGTGA